MIHICLETTAPYSIFWVEALRRAIGNPMAMTMVFKAVRLGFCLLEKVVIDLKDIHSRLSEL